MGGVSGTAGARDRRRSRRLLPGTRSARGHAMPRDGDTAMSGQEARGRTPRLLQRVSWTCDECSSPNQRRGMAETRQKTLGADIPPRSPPPYHQGLALSPLEIRTPLLGPALCVSSCAARGSLPPFFGLLCFARLAPPRLRDFSFRFVAPPPSLPGSHGRGDGCREEPIAPRAPERDCKQERYWGDFFKRKRDEQVSSASRTPSRRSRDSYLCEKGLEAAPRDGRPLVSTSSAVSSTQRELVRAA